MGREVHLGPGKSLHFVPCVLEPCMYHMRYKGTPIYMCIYVDDIIIECSELAYIWVN